MAKKNVNLRIGWDLKAFSDSSQNLSRELTKVGKQMKSVGKDMSTYITAPLAIMGGLAVKTFADFEQSMAKVKAISGATGAEFQNLNKLAKDLGISTRFSASEVSDLMLNYSKLGFSSSEIEKITGATLNLALATGEDLAKSAEVAGGALRGFGLDASQMDRVVNTMAAGFSMSGLDLDKFQLGMGKVSAVAKNAGQSIESTTAMLGILANNNIEASTAGTGLKNILLTLSKTGMTYDEAMNKIATSTDKNKIAMDMFGRENAAVAITLATSKDAVNELTDSILNAKDPAAAMAAIMDNTLQGSMFKLKSATEGLAISFGEVMAPAIAFLADLLAGIAMWFSELSPSMKTAITVVAGLAAAIGPLVFVIGSLTVAFAALSAAQIQTTLIIAGVIIAIGAIVAAFLYVKNNLQAFKDFFYNAWVGIANGFIDILKSMVTPFLKFANILGLDIGTGINAFLDSFKLKSRESTAQFGSFKDTLQDVKKDLTETTTEIDKTTESVKDLGKEAAKPIKLGIDFSKGIEAANLQSPAIDAIQKGLKSKGLKFDEPIKAPVQIDIKPIELSQELFDQQAIAAAKKQAADLGEEMGDALSSGLKALATESLASFGDFIGDSLTSKTMMNDQLKNTEEHYDNLIKAAKQNGEDIAKLEQEKADMVAQIQESFTFENRVEDFGRGLLDSIGKFMGQFGEAMIAMGIAQVMLDVAIKSFNPALAIIGGVALVAAGAAISNLSQKGVSASGSGGSSFSGGGGFSSMSGIGANMQPIVLDTRISGRDMIITQGRESQFKR